MRAAKLCSTPECTHVQPCPEHGRAPWSGSRRRDRVTLSGSREQKRARYILELADTICHVCGWPGATQVDHVVPLSQGGTDMNDNLAPIHRLPCHEEKTRREAREGRK